MPANPGAPAPEGINKVVFKRRKVIRLWQIHTVRLLLLLPNFVPMSIRQDKFAKQIQRDLGSIFQQYNHSWFGGNMLTISGVQVSPDLGHARVYLSLYTVKNRQAAMELVELHAREIRQELARKIRHEVKKVPELVFMLDESLDYLNKMDEIFAQLNKDPQKDEE
jgi:ribosome-binding factor A